ncbi:MAG: Octanoyltransferase [Alphaproteobacteria bacterium MarineAlpha5_Bin9]|nr:MAG: Octanoyltransferase [Alphaproteobacteria bacterium MarineAlpha5_Bin9]|tara:strand:+ start:14912 stop:15556 length:645 start_codon:yes stop_codon:yes gene_type:complete
MEINKKKSHKLIDYKYAIKFMEKKVDQIIQQKSNELIWFLTHNDVYTCGTSAQKKEILKITNIPIISTNRGGKTTYHGKGQRIVYLMINLNNRKKDIRLFINILEKTIHNLLYELEIKSKSYKNRIGIWVTEVKGIKLKKEKKIGSIGLRIKKWVTFHGLSFNICPNLSYYDNIVACGLENYETTSLKDLGIILSDKEFDEKFAYHFLKEINKF